MNTIKFDEKKYIIIFARLAIGLAFISAVADRFGIWGNPGDTNVAWGNFGLFKDYVTYLNPFLSDTFVWIISYLVTFLEVFLALMLIFGLKLKSVCLLSAILLLMFAISMTFVMGIKVPFDYSVFTASAACFLLYLLVEEKNK